MADKPLFNLDTKGRWRLAYDRQQWMIQRRAGEAMSAGLRQRGYAQDGLARGFLRWQQEGDAGAELAGAIQLSLQVGK